MPTGYTADVVSGKITDLRSFALLCARGMGALIMMRDAPWDAPIPERFEPSTHYRDELAKVQAELAELRALSPADWQAKADAEYAADCESRDAYFAEKAEGRERYDAMLKQVRAWKNPPEGIKSFMIEQLERGRDFDCGDGDYWKLVERKTGEEWKVKREQELMRCAARYAEEWQKEQDRTEGRNAWIAQLRRSLDQFDAQPLPSDPPHPTDRSSK